MKAKKVTICARLRPKYAELLKKIAENKEKNTSELIRDIVENYVDMHM